MDDLPAKAVNPRRATDFACGATVVAVVGIVASWLLPWIGELNAPSAIGTSIGFDAEGPGGQFALIGVCWGLVGLFAVIFAVGGLVWPWRPTHVTCTVLAVVGAALCWGAAAIPHDRFVYGAYGIAPIVGVAAFLGLAACQLVLAGWPRAVGVRLRRWVVAVGLGAAALLAAVVWFGGSTAVAAVNTNATKAPATADRPRIELHHDAVFAGVTARDDRTGAERWHYYVRGWAVEEARLTSDGSTVLVAGSNSPGSSVLAFDPATGALRWRQPLPGYSTWSALTDSEWRPGARIVYGSGVWFLERGGPPPGNAPNGDARLSYIDGADGHRWSVPFPDSHGDCSVIAADGDQDGIVYLRRCINGPGGSWTRSVISYGPDGRQRWSTPFTGGARGSDADGRVQLHGGVVTVTVQRATTTLNTRTGAPVGPR